MKILKQVVILGIVFSLIGCASIDRGYWGFSDKEEIPDSEISLMKTSRYIRLTKIDDKKTGWFNLFGLQKEVIRLKPGVHTLTLEYNDGYRYSTSDTSLIVNLEKGRSYTIKGTINLYMIEYNVIDDISYRSVVLDETALKGNKNTVLSKYIKNVLNHTMEEVNKTVILENDSYKLVFKSDMVFELTNKTDDSVIIGRRGFAMDFAMADGTTYLYPVNLDEMSSEVFLNECNYQTESEYALKVISCDESSVTYEYLRPISKKGEQITFSITQPE